MSQHEEFTAGEWCVIQSAMLRYRMRMQDRLSLEDRPEAGSELMKLIKETEAKVNRLVESGGIGIEATAVKRPVSNPESKNTGRWGQGGPGSDDYFSFADWEKALHAAEALKRRLMS